MDVQHPSEPGPKFPLSSAFELEGVLEDGVTDSRRQVLGGDFMGRREGSERPEPHPLARLAEPEPGEPSRVRVSPEAPRHPAVPRVESLLGRVGDWLEPRIANEELGDALERIHGLAGARAPAWVLYAMTGVSVFWALTHAVQESARRLVGRLRKRLPAGPNG